MTPSSSPQKLGATFTVIELDTDLADSGNSNHSNDGNSNHSNNTDSGSVDTFDGMPPLIETRTAPGNPAEELDRGDSQPRKDRKGDGSETEDASAHKGGHRSGDPDQSWGSALPGTEREYEHKHEQECEPEGHKHISNDDYSENDNNDDDDETTGDEVYDYNYKDDDNSMEEFDDCSSVSIEYLDDSDNSDDEENDSHSDHEMTTEMYHFFHMIAQMENSHVYSDDDDWDDDGNSDSDSDSGSNNDSDSDSDSDSDNNNPYDDDEEDDSDPCTCPHCQMDRIIECGDCWDDDSVDDELPLDPDASPCAICMEAETTKRRFVHLPCCGARPMARNPTSGIPVDTSSTRFCQKCLARYLVTNGCAVPCSDPSNKAKIKPGSRAQLAGECPRCKNLLVLKECKCATTKWHTNDDADADDDAIAGVPLRGLSKQHKNEIGLPFYKRNYAATPSTEALFWYVARSNKGHGGTGDAEYRNHLLTLSTCPNPNYIPEELLLNNSGSPDKIRNLCQWGLLFRRKNTRERLQRLQRAMSALQRIIHAVLEQLRKHNKVLKSNRVWQVIASAVCLRFQTSRSRIHNWKVSEVLRSFAETFHQLPNRAGTVYRMDPLVQSELHSLVLRHLQCSVDGERFDKDRDCDHDDYGADCALRLLLPRSSSSSTTDNNDDDDDNQGADHIEIEAFCEINGRRQCFLAGWNSFDSAWMAARRFRIFRSLLLISHGVSLALLSSFHLGLPPIIELQLQLSVTPPLAASCCCSEQPKGMMHRHSSLDSEAWFGNTRWRWHAMSGLNVILVVLGLKIVVQLVCIGIRLVLAVSMCLVVGRIVGSTKAGNGSIRRKPSEEKDQHALTWLEHKRLFGGFIVMLYVVWHASAFAYLVPSIE